MNYRVTVQWCSYDGKQYGGFSKKSKIELSDDPITPLLGLYPKEWEAENHRDICTPMFTAALFTTDRGVARV